MAYSFGFEGFGGKDGRVMVVDGACPNYIGFLALNVVEGGLLH